MASIEQRVVQMRFDNAQFEKGVKQTSVSLQKLKSDTKFDGSSSGLKQLAADAKNLDFSSAAQSAGGFVSQLGVLQVAIGNVLGAGLTRLASMASNAMSQFTVKPLIDGFNEYETKLNSVQTILANTAHKGTTMTQVTAALNDLNTYADKTIYNFGQMTDAIGKFTSAGVDLDTATASIKGMANMAAMAGSDTNQLNTAMYQVSQALAAGSVKLQDWNSIVNAGMGGENFQELFQAVNKVKHATDATIPSAEAAIQKQGNFRESLKEGWLTTEVYAEAAKIMTGDLSKEQLISMGYSEEQAQKFAEMAANAQDAATKVKTFTQLLDVIGEAIGSGWAQSFEIIFGNLEEARELWTGVYNAIEPLINQASDARNAWLGTLKMFGTFKEIQWTLQHVFSFLGQIVGAIAKAFNDVFGSATDAFSAEKVVNFVHWLAVLSAKLENVSSVTGYIRRTFAGFFAILHLGWTILSGVAKIIWTIVSTIAGALFPVLGSTSGGILAVTASIADVVVWFDKFIYKLDIFGTIARGVAFVLNFVINAIKTLVTFVVDGVRSLGQALNVTARLSSFISKLAELAKIDLSPFTTIGDKFRALRNGFASLAMDEVSELPEKFKELGSTLKAKAAEYGITAASFTTNAAKFKEGAKAFGEAASDLFESAKVKIAPFVDIVKKLFAGIGDKIVNALGDMAKGIGATTKKLDFGGVLEALIGGIATGGAIVAIKALLSYFQGLKEAAEGWGSIGKSIAGAFDELGGALNAAKQQFQMKAVLYIAGAILILTAAVYLLGKMDKKAFEQGMAGLVIISIGVVSAIKSFNELSKSSAAILAVGPGLMVVAIAVLLIAAAVRLLAKLDAGDLAKGVVSIKIIFTMITNMATTLSGAKAGPILAAGAAMNLMAIALLGITASIAILGNMDIKTLVVGVGVVSMLVGGFTYLANTLNPASAASIIALGGAFALVAIALNVMVSAIALLGVIPTDILIQGVLGVAAVVAILTISLKTMNPASVLPNAIGALALAFAVNLVVGALAFLGLIPIPVLLQGAIGLTAVLMALAVASQVMGSGSLGGAAGMIGMALALNLLVGPIKQLGEIPLKQLAIGIGAFALVLGVLVLAGYAASLAGPGLLMLSVALLALGVAVGLVGIGLGIVALGLGTIAAAGMAAVTVLASALGVIIGLLPSLATAVAQAFINFLSVLNANFPVIQQTFGNFLVMLCDLIITYSPNIAQAIGALVDILIDTLVNNIPRLVAAGLKMLLGILKGLRDNMAQIVSTAIEVIAELVRGLGQGAAKLVQAAADAIETFAKALEDNHDRIVASGKKIGWYIIDGLTLGLANKALKFIEKIKELCSKAWDAICDFFGISSPSKLMKQAGVWMGEGMIIGLDKSSGAVASAAEDLAAAAYEPVKGALAELENSLGDEMTLEPVVKPELDMTNLHDFSTDGAFTLTAANVVADQARIQSSSTQSSPDAQNGQSVVFNQYNNSPKALNEAEVYRQTNSLIRRTDRQKALLA